MKINEHEDIWSEGAQGQLDTIHSHEEPGHFSRIFDSGGPTPRLAVSWQWNMPTIQNPYTTLAKSKIAVGD